MFAVKYRNGRIRAVEIVYLDVRDGKFMYKEKESRELTIGDLVSVIYIAVDGAIIYENRELI
ncbi:MAG: hypothetical protein ACRCZ0_01230 [Cetobacterium sp.]